MEYRDHIRQFIVANFLFEDGSQLNDTDSLLATGVIDSTGVLELIYFLESEYQISIAPEELMPENMDSIENIAHFIERKCSSRVALAGGPVPDLLPGASLGAAADKR